MEWVWIIQNGMKKERLYQPIAYYLRYVVDKVGGDRGGQVPVQLRQHQHLTLLQEGIFKCEVEGFTINKFFIIKYGTFTMCKIKNVRLPIF